MRRDTRVDGRENIRFRFIFSPEGYLFSQPVQLTVAAQSNIQINTPTDTHIATSTYAATVLLHRIYSGCVVAPY